MAAVAAMAIDFSIFRANDIRGVADSSLSVEVAEQIGRALAAVAAERGFARIALGRDGRESSPRLSAAVAAGLVAGGMRVFDIGVNPTPAVYYAAATRADGCGAVVTGSHNPKNYNGVKMMLGNETLSGDAVADLAARIRGGFAPSARVGGCEPIDVAPAYLAELRANIRLARPLKIVVDAGNGATGDFAPKMLRALGCEVDELFCEIDGAFPNHHPDPARPENLRAAANRRRELGADAAFVFDGDGDRLGAILPESGAVAADRLLMLFARDCLRAASGRAVVFDVKCTRHLAPWIAACGGVAHMRPTGHAFIKRAMAELDAVCGGEMSGHFYFRDKWRGFDDAIFAAARLAEILARDPNAAADLPASPASPEINIDLPDGETPHGLMRKIEDLVAAAPPPGLFPRGIKTSAIDGLRIEYEDGFGLVRASNTTPCMVLRFEGDSEDAMRAIQSEFRAALAAVDSRLTTPF